MNRETQRYHLVGVAGSGMSGLARLLLAQGGSVSGSDRFSDAGTDLAVIRKLRAAGVDVVSQDGSGIDGSGCTVIASSAVERDNPDLAAARRAGAPVVGRAEMLARLADGKECIAVAGTSGKSTVTGMAGWILDSLGSDPTVVDGGAVLNWISEREIGNVRIGRTGPWVLETDESDRSLLMFHPDWAIITNVGKDHFDLAETEALFGTFAGQVRRGIIRPGHLSGSVRVISESFSGTRFFCAGMEYVVPVPGRHNVDNAVQAVALCEMLGFSPDRIASALARFKGIERRLQVAGCLNGAVVIDDFAHNPAKIMASWRSVAPHFSRILAVWRPHGFKPLEFMHDELVETIAAVCRPADVFCVLPVFYAGGTVERRVTSETFAACLAKRGVNALNLPGFDAGIEYLARTAADGDAVLIMGARDPGLPEMARSLAALGAR